MVVSLTPDMKVLDSTWTFECKGYPDGNIRSLKQGLAVEATSKSIKQTTFQEGIALGTMEAEYLALSRAICDLLAIK